MDTDDVLEGEKKTQIDRRRKEKRVRREIGLTGWRGCKQPKQGDRSRGTAGRKRNNGTVR